MCDDTDVFALLIHYVYFQRIECPVLMQSTKSGKSVVDIHCVIRGMESRGIDPSLILPLHDLSECDTVASCFGVGKIKALVVIKDHSLLLNL